MDRGVSSLVSPHTSAATVGMTRGLSRSFKSIDRSPAKPNRQQFLEKDTRALFDAMAIMQLPCHPSTTQVDNSVHEPCKLFCLQSNYIRPRSTAFHYHPCTVLPWTVLVAGTSPNPIFASCFEQSSLQGRRSKTPVRSRVTAIIEGSLGGAGGSNNRQQQQQSQSSASSPRPQSVAGGSPRGFSSPVLPQSNPASPRPHSCLGSPKPSSLMGSPKPSSCVSSPRPQSCLSSPRMAASGSSGSPRGRSFQHQAPQFDMFSGGQQVKQGHFWVEDVEGGIRLYCRC